MFSWSLRSTCLVCLFAFLSIRRMRIISVFSSISTVRRLCGASSSVSAPAVGVAAARNSGIAFRSISVIIKNYNFKEAPVFNLVGSMEEGRMKPIVSLCSRNICRGICTCGNDRSTGHPAVSVGSDQRKRHSLKSIKRKMMSKSKRDDGDTDSVDVPVVEGKLLQPLATYKVCHNANDENGNNDFLMVISKGSVVDFSHRELYDGTRGTNNNNDIVPLAAIVNAANEGCIGGGGVDGAINAAGGEQLVKDRMALSSELPGYPPGVRCPTGKARITGPCFPTYGKLHVPFVIHAVGPAYMDYADNLELGDALLYSAYRSSLRVAKKHNIQAIGFSLLSSGIFRYTRSLDQVLWIAVKAIQDFEGYPALQEVHLCAFNQKEADTLMKVSNGLFRESSPVQSHPQKQQNQEEEGQEEEGEDENNEN